MTYQLPPELASLRQRALERRDEHRRVRHEARTFTLVLKPGAWVSANILALDDVGRGSPKSRNLRQEAREALTWRHGPRGGMQVRVNGKLFAFLDEHYIGYKKA